MIDIINQWFSSWPSTTKAIAACFGLPSIILSLTLSSGLLFKQEVKDEKRTITEIPYLPALLSMTNQLGYLKIEYDSQLNILDSGILTVTFDYPFIQPTKEQLKKFKLELSGPNVEIAPEGKIDIPENPKDEFKPKWSWTYRAQSAGNNTLSLQLSNVPYKKWYKLNQDKTPYELENPIILPLEVSTATGLNARFESLIKFIGPVIGFILMYPLFLEWLHKRPGLSNVNGDAKTTSNRYKNSNVDIVEKEKESLMKIRENNEDVAEEKNNNQYL